MVPVPGEGEGFAFPLPPEGFVPGPRFRPFLSPEGLPEFAEGLRAAGAFRPEVNAFFPDLARSPSLACVDFLALSGPCKDPGARRRLWAALNSGVASAVSLDGFFRSGGTVPRLAAELSAALAEEKTSPFKLGRFLWWNFADSGAAGEPRSVRAG